ncbi:rho guanine nucleotide exchange factor 1b isoform X3 [Pygocentrus nattereri]|uniref:rho guanine nucleotide exchange factor 1b isoform X3 n=1 Tax=Pygocentrus nattereri TaxID=42514 RepID=UPI0008149C88|nr:rho guanine nucleotide exchange factor 1b isoform X3 [Pygocentrus nattereri]
MDFVDAHEGRGLSGAHGFSVAMSIIGAEDEDFENDLNQTVDDQCYYFNSIELLKSRPTHLLVFLHHVMLQFDCAPVLCYLHADMFKNLSAKETKKHFGDFYNSFLDKGAILRVSVPVHVSNELDRTRPELLSEDQQRRYAQEVQNMQTMEVLRQLEDFRQKRMMGMTPNEHELSQVENHYQTDRVPREMKEKAVAEMLLERLLEANPTIVADEDKCSTIFSAVVVYMKHLGVKTRTPDSKKSKGFFKWKYAKKEENKTQVRSVIPNILNEAGRRIVGRNEAKPATEADKASERKSSGSASVHRGSSSEGSTTTVRKQVVAGPGTIQGTEGTDAQLSNLIITTSPESTQSDTAMTTSRSDPAFVYDVGDISPISSNTGLSLLESCSANDIPTEDSHEKDRSVRRSESLCVERRHSRRGGSARAKQSRSRSDVDLQSTATSHPPPSPLLHPVSPDVASLPEGTLTASSSGPSLQQEEVEPRLLELEQDPPNWRELASSEVLSKLSKKEMKRQEVINELFATEHAHVRMLSVLQTVFYRPLEREEIMSTTELDAIFPSLDDIIDLHYTFYENLKRLRQEDGFVVKTISTPLLNRFNGSEGDWFQKLAARFCSHQSWALDLIKSRQKKDPRFNAFILDAESKPQCRRLQLKDIIPIEMQRLTKYPLLLENIAKSTEDNAERENIQQAAECCRKILNHVNEEVKYMENLLTLKDYQRRLDTSGLKPSNELYLEYKNFDLTTRSMLYEGALTWRVTKEKAIDVQGVLLGDLLVLLQKQDDKMLLKCQSKSIIAAQEGKQMLSPIIKLDSAFLREVATDRKAFYVIFTWDSGAQIYELVAQSVGERKAWTEKIKLSMDELKKNGCSTLDRARPGSMPGGSTAMHYSSSLQPPLSPIENGADPLKNNAGRDKDSLTDEKSRHSQASVIDYLAANGFDPLGHSNAPPEKSASGALDEVTSLKRMLVGSISLSEDTQPDGENGGGSAKQDTDTDGSQSLEEHSTEGQEEEEHGKVKIEEVTAVAAPLVLSHESMKEVCRKLDSLEDKLKKLQNVEEEYHRLQDALAKFTIQRGSYN